MKKALLFLLMSMCVVASVSAQAVKTTSVSINATDTPDGQVWSNGTYATSLVINPGTSTATSSPGPSGPLDASGNATFVLTSENDITFPAKAKWQVTVCPQMGCVVGTLDVSFTKLIASTLGTSISINLSPLSPRIPINAAKPVNAYRDSEVISATTGAIYFNIPSFTLRYCQANPCALSWAPLSAGGGGSGGAFAALLPGLNTSPGTFAGAGNTWDFSGALALKAPVLPSALPTASGSFAYDPNLGAWEFGSNGSTLEFGLASSPCSANNFVSQPATAFAPATCSQPAFSGISGNVNLASQVTGNLSHSNIASTAVTPGSYTSANITVAADGSITSASNGSAGSASFSVLTAGTNSNAGTFAASGSLWDFSAATGLVLPNIPGAAPTTSGSIAYDSTSNRYEAGVNGSNTIIPTTTGGSTGFPTNFSTASTLVSAPIYVSVDSIQGGGIGAASTPWITATTYPLCQAVSFSGGNYLAVNAANGATTPGTNGGVWYPVPNASRPTQYDCAFYIAQSLVSVAAGTGVDLQLGKGTYNSCIGMTYPTVGSPGFPGVNIHGAGRKVSIISQTCHLDSGSGGDGLAMLNVPQASVGSRLPTYEWTDFTLASNALAPAIFDLHACQHCLVKNLYLNDPLPGTDHVIEIGTVGGGTTGWVFELTMEDVVMSYNPAVTGFGHGNYNFTSTVAVSGGVPTVTITNGGTGYDVNQLTGQFVLAGGLSACSSQGTNTFTVASGVITGVSTTATGCNNSATVYFQIYPQIDVNYGFKFSNMSDSRFISDLNTSGIGQTCGISTSNVTSANIFYKLHPIHTFNGVCPQGNNDFISTQLDSMHNWGVDFEGVRYVQNWYGTMIEWDQTTYTASSKYHFGTVVGTPTSAPAQININGDICLNVPAQGGYGDYVVPLGLVEAGQALPTFITLTFPQYCANAATNAVQVATAAQNINWSNGIFGNVWKWGLGSGGGSVLNLTGPTTSPWTFNFLNGNAATSGANNRSPIQTWQGAYWDGSVSQSYGAKYQTIFAAGSGPLATLSFAAVGTEPAAGHKWAFDAPVGLKISTFASLPTGVGQGAVAVVTDALNTSAGCAGGGTTTAVAVYTGSVWNCSPGRQVRTIGARFGDAATGATLTTAEVSYVTIPFACSITGWHIMADAGTATVKVWRVNGGTALPTVTNSINTSGVSLSTGTKIDSTTVSDFTSTSLAVNDTLGVSLSAVATAKQITFQLDCLQ